MRIFEDDSMAGLGPVGTRDVRNAHPCEQEAEGDQERYQGLRPEMVDMATDHKVSEWLCRSLIA